MAPSAFAGAFAASTPRTRWCHALSARGAYSLSTADGAVPLMPSRRSLDLVDEIRYRVDDSGRPIRIRLRSEERRVGVGSRARRPPHRHTRLVYFTSARNTAQT